MSILEIDAGNTFLKWRVIGSAAEGSLASGRVLIDESSLWLNSLEKLMAGLRLDFVRVCSVRSQDFDRQLTRVCEKGCGLRPVFAQVAREGYSVRPVYEQLGQLGVDRWLIMLAAYKRCKGACITLSCGTALTVDFVADSGDHLGGYILPGSGLMQNALGHGVAAINIPRLPWSRDLRPGVDTVSCVQNGLSLMMKSLLIEVIDNNSVFVDAVPVFTVGGDAQDLNHLVSDAVSAPMTYASDLLFEGLAEAVPLGGAKA